MSTSGAFVDATKLPKAGTYTIVIDPQGSATGNSTVRLFDVPPDAAAAIVLGGPALPLATTTPGQNARLTFTGVAGRRASLSLAPTCCATAISVLAPDGAEVADDSSITTTGLFLEPWTLPQSGTYTIAVDPGGHGPGERRDDHPVEALGHESGRQQPRVPTVRLHEREDGDDPARGERDPHDPPESRGGLRGEHDRDRALGRGEPARSM